MPNFSIDQSRLTRILDAADAAQASVREAGAAERDARERLSRKRRELEAIANGRGQRGERPRDPNQGELDQVRAIEHEVENLASATARASERSVHTRRIASSCLDYARPAQRPLMDRVS